MFFLIYFKVQPKGKGTMLYISQYTTQCVEYLFSFSFSFLACKLFCINPVCELPEKVLVSRPRTYGAVGPPSVQTVSFPFPGISAASYILCFHL